MYGSIMRVVTVDLVAVDGLVFANANWTYLIIVKRNTYINNNHNIVISYLLHYTCTRNGVSRKHNVI